MVKQGTAKAFGSGALSERGEAGLPLEQRRRQQPGGATEGGDRFVPVRSVLILLY